jgi:hypothetical protein
MPGINISGRASTDDYLVGRGILYFSSLTADLPAGGYRDLGNAPSAKLTATTDKIDHKSSRSGLATIDKTIITGQKFEFSCELDEVTNFENLAFALSGSIASPQPTNSAIAGFAEYEMISAVAEGRWYPIQNATGVRAYDIATANLTVEKQGAPDVLLVEGTDYEVDEQMGRIFFIQGGANYAPGDDIDVTLAADAGAVVLERVWALTSTPTAGALVFIGENPANNDAQIEMQIHKIALALDGDLGFISDDVSKFSLKGVCELNEIADASSPYFNITTHANAFAP